MQSPIIKILKTTARNSADFIAFKKNVIKALAERDSEAYNSERVTPFLYIDALLQEIRISDIANADNLVDRAHMQLRNIRRGMVGGHGAAIGRQIGSPIAVEMSSAGTYDIIDGFHRSVQVIMNGDDTIFAFVVGASEGITLKKFYEQAICRENTVNHSMV